jgi:hypothetical protein
MNTERMETPAERELSAYRAEIRNLRAEDIDLESVERGILERLKEVGREMLAEAMQRADTVAPEVDIEGSRWGSRRVQKASYQGIFGTMELERSTYQRAGRGRVAVAMDRRLGVVEGAYTPLMARILTRAIAVMTEHEASDFLGEVGLATVSNSTLSRIPRAIAARYETRRAIIESALREQDDIPEGAATVQAALDGVMVPQDGEYARPRGRATDSPEPPRYERSYGVVGPPSPADSDSTEGRSWHEASVATLAFFVTVRPGTQLPSADRGRSDRRHGTTRAAVAGMVVKDGVALEEHGRKRSGIRGSRGVIRDDASRVVEQVGT